jgi:hypothetical protein
MGMFRCKLRTTLAVCLRVRTMTDSSVFAAGNRDPGSGPWF